MTSTAARPTLALPRSTPEEQGLDPAAVERLLEAFDTAGLELHSLMVVRHGHVVAEGWWAPYERDGLHLLYSLSKSFTATAIGLAVEEGRLSVDDLVTDFFPDDLPAQPHPHLARMRVRHLLSMATGHREDTLERLDRQRLLPSFFALTPEEEPGTWFAYNNGATYLLSAILTKLTGQRVLDYLRPRLLEPLGIADANWQGFADVDLGFSGLHLTTESIAAFGQLFLQQGVWQGRQLVPRSWVAEASRRQVDNPREPSVDWRQGYGYQFWMGQEGYRGDGAFGQFCLVLPAVDTVVAITAATDTMQAVLDAVWEQLLPALRLDHGVGRPGSDTLTRRLADLGLATPEGDRQASEVSLPWAAPAGNADGQAVCRIVSIVEDGTGWRLTLTDQQATFEVGCGYRTWVTTDVEVAPGRRLRVAASGAWSGSSTFTADVTLVQTPHRLLLSCDCTTGVSTARWNVAPLGPTSPSELALELARG